MFSEEDKAKLLAAGPNFFRGVSDPTSTPASPLSQRGFEIGSGWVVLVCEMAKEIENLITSLPEEDRASVYCTQCKEKFGALRVYFSHPRGNKIVVDALSAIVDVAESKSKKTCEDCGNPGRLVNPSGWVFASCPRCLAAYFDRKIDDAKKYNRVGDIIKLKKTKEEWATDFNRVADEEEQDL